MHMRLIVAAGIAMLVASLCVVFMGTRERPTLASSPQTLGMTTDRLRPVLPAWEPEAAPAATVASDAWSLHDAPAQVAQRWREAKDKRAFFDRAVEAGGGAYLHFAGKALAACGNVNRLGVIGAEQGLASMHRVDDPAFSTRLAAFRVATRGCEAFEARPVTEEEEAALLRRLLESPDLVGRIYAHKLWALTAETHDAARESAREAIESGDPELLQLVHPALAARHFAARGRDAREAIGEDMRDELSAWRWALCELGLDCTSAGAFGRSLCIAGGKCDWESVDEIAAASFPGASARRKDALVAAVRSRDWGALGL